MTEVVHIEKELRAILDDGDADCDADCGMAARLICRGYLGGLDLIMSQAILGRVEARGLIGELDELYSYNLWPYEDWIGVGHALMAFWLGLDEEEAHG